MLASSVTPNHQSQHPPAPVSGAGIFLRWHGDKRRAGEYRSISGAAIRAAPEKIMPSQPEPTPRWPRRSPAGSDTARPDSGAGYSFLSETHSYAIRYQDDTWATLPSKKAAVEPASAGPLRYCCLSLNLLVEKHKRIPLLTVPAPSNLEHTHAGQE